MILVTGGAGFIGSNFVLDWLAGGGEPVVNLDKLTYAGNLANLASLAGDARHRFVQGDIGDQAAVEAHPRRAPPARRRALRRREPRRPLDPRARRVRRRPTSSAPSGCWRPRAATGSRSPEARAGGVPLPARLDRRGLRLALGRRTRPSRETTAYAPNSPYSASKAASDHLVRAYHHTYGLPALTTNCSNNYGPVPVPREADPAHDRQRARGQAPAGLRRRPAGARLALRGRPLRGHPDGAREGPPGRGLQHRRQRARSATSRWCTRFATRSQELRPREGGYRGLDHATWPTGPATTGATRSTRARSAPSSGWTPRETFESGLARTVRWYLDNAAWVAQVRSGEYRHWIEKNYGKRA